MLRADFDPGWDLDHDAPPRDAHHRPQRMQIMGVTDRVLKQFGFIALLTTLLLLLIAFDLWLLLWLSSAEELSSRAL